MTSLAAPAEPVVRVDGVHRAFGEVRALDGASLQASAGEVVGLLGHNGAGKTTMVRLLTGVLTPDAGSVRVHGLDPQVDGPAVRRATGVVSANPAVDDRLTAEQNLHFVGDVFGVDRAVTVERTRDLLERFELSRRTDERVQGFSSGMRQRLAFARALLPEPPLLLLDEPTAMLDPVASRDVRELVDRLAREESRCVVICSHNLVEVQQLCDRVVVLEHGRVIATGPPSTLAAELGIGRLRVDVDPRDVDTARRIVEECGATVRSVRGGQLDTEELAGVHVPDVVAALVHAGARVHAVVPLEASLEDVYLALHGRKRP